MQLALYLDSISLTDSISGGSPLSHTVDCQDRCFFKRRREKRTGGVRFVMLTEDDAFLIFALQFPFDDAGQMQFGLQPAGNRIQKRAKTKRSESQRGFEQPLKFQKRFFIEACIEVVSKPKIT